MARSWLNRYLFNRDLAIGSLDGSLLGWNRVRNYDGSMREWANRDDTPLVLESAGG